MATRSKLKSIAEALEPRQLLSAYVVGSPTAYATIQAAVNAAAAGATIRVDAGTYPELVTVYKDGLTIQGANAGADARSTTRLSATGTTESVLTGTTASSGRTSSFYVNANRVTIDGFTVQGNTSQTYYGAGIVIAPNRYGTKILNNVVQNNVSGLFLANNSTSEAAVIRQNVFRNNNNAGPNGGRGIYTDQSFFGEKLSNVTIDANAFINNRGSSGTTWLESAVSFEAGVAGLQSDVRITNNVFDGNGKAVMFFNTTKILVSGNVLTNTLDWYSGTLRFEGNNHDVRIQNNTIYLNTGPGVAVDSKGVPGDSSGFVVTNNNVYNNSTTAGKQVGVVVNGDQYVGTFDARNNFWGHASGPSGDGPGTGDAVYGIGHVVPGKAWYVQTGGSELFSPWSTTGIGTLNTPYFGLPATPGETIQAEDFDHGGQGYAYNDTTAGNANRGYRPNQGVDIATSSDTGGGFGVGNVVAGEWLRYTVNVLRSGTYSLGFRIANGQSSAGTFHLEADGTDLTGPISVAPTGGWQTWTTLTKSNVLLSAGTKVLRLVMDAVGSAGAVANFNWLKLTLDAATPDPVPAAPTALAAAAASATLVNLAWRDNATNESGYVVERRTGTGGAWQQIATLAANSTSYADAAVAPATAYTYRVRATTTAGENSANSNESAVTTPALPATTYLSDLAWVSATNGWGPVERDTSVGGSGAGDGGTLTLNGVTYAKGLGTHAPSEIIYNLSGNYRGFLADVGIDDRQTTQGSVVFQVYADDVLVYDSGIMRPTTPTRAVSLDVTGVRQLRLLVGDAGDGIGHDHADWANARLTTASVDNALVAPTNVAATALAPTQVRVLWTDNSTAETGYKVERSLDSGKTWTQIATAAANSSSYFDTTARAGLSYGYRVRATTGSADSAYSEATYIVTPAAVSLVTYVSDLQWESATNGWGPVERDMGNGGSGAGDGPAITLNGVVYDKGLGTHAGSEVVVRTNGSYGRFVADVGVDDRQALYGSVVFRVYGDGVLLFDSGVMGATSATMSVNVALTGVELLRLVVTDAGDGVNYDHADWAGARLLMATA